MGNKGMMCWVKRVSALVASTVALNVGLRAMNMDILDPLLKGMGEGMQMPIAYFIGLCGAVSLVCSVKWCMSSKC